MTPLLQGLTPFGGGSAAWLLAAGAVPILSVVRRVLLLHYTPHPRAVRLTTQQHLDALAAIGDADVLAYNAVNGAPGWLRHLRWDAVVLHTTVLGMRWNIWFDGWRRRLDWLADVPALKIAFPQDEYDHAHVLDAWLDDLGVTVVGTVLHDTNRAALYPVLHAKAAFHEVLTGYVGHEQGPGATILPGAPHERPFDVVYRARHLPYWYGSHGQLKHLVGDAVLERAPGHGLTTDVSTRAPETILGGEWLRFLAQGRTTVGVESGSSVLDRAGEVRDRVSELLHDDPGLSFADVDAGMPAGWDDYRFFAISPRHLEAVATRTVQILVEGRYSGVLEAGVHYLPVRRDFSDLDGALEHLRDHRLLEEMAERAYADVVASGRWSTRRLTETLEAMLDEHGASHSGAPGSAHRLAARAASAEEEVVRIAVAPAVNVTRVGGAGVREMAAGLRHVVPDRTTRALLLEYLAATEIREHISPRRALADLLCLSALRTAGRTGAPFGVAAQLDRERRRVLFSSHQPHDRADIGSLRRDELETLLRTSAVDFAWDHSRIGRGLAFPILPGRAIDVPLPAGPHALPLLNWLGRRRPDLVADALAPLLVGA